MKAKALLAGAFVLFAVTAVQADPNIPQTAFSLENATTAQDVFAPDTPKVVLHVQLDGITAPTQIESDWIAEKTDVAPANYKIDSTQLTAQPGMQEATFDMSKPDAGWPVGDYRVDVLIDGKQATSAKFTVAK